MARLRIGIAKTPQRNERAGRVVRVRHAAAQRSPRPGARRGVRERMLARALLRQQPLPHRRRVLAAAARRPPRARQSRASSPTSRGSCRSASCRRRASTRRGTGRPHPRPGSSVCPIPARLMTTKLVSGVASRYPPLSGCIARRSRCVTPRTRPLQRARDGIARRREVMPHLSDRDERRQRVAHDRQLKMLEPAMRQRGQLERQLRNRPPRNVRVVAELARQCEHGQDRHREGLVLSVAAQDREHEALPASCRPRRAAATPRIGPRPARQPGHRPAVFESAAQTIAVVLMLLRLRTVSPHPPSAF